VNAPSRRPARPSTPDPGTDATTESDLVSAHDLAPIGERDGSAISAEIAAACRAPLIDAAIGERPMRSAGCIVARVRVEGRAGRSTARFTSADPRGGVTMMASLCAISPFRLRNQTPEQSFPVDEGCPLVHIPLVSLLGVATAVDAEICR